MKNKKALVCGAGGFIGSHLVKKLKKEVGQAQVYRILKIFKQEGRNETN